MKKSAAVTPRVTLQRSLLSMAVAAATFGMAPAHAVQFELMDGEVTGSFDTTMSYGALWRVTGQDPRLISAQKGGSRNSGNYDNGNANYDRGDLVSSLFKVTHDVDLNYKNFGAFARVLYFYDHAIQNKDFNPNLADKRTIRNRLGHDYEIYDAYVRGSFKVADRNLNVRAGKQVISWGESTFIPNGLNTLNPVDVAKLRAPGSELKEAFLPIQMLQLTYDITDNVSLELINMFQFRATRLEPNGSYFSTNDFASPGGDIVLIGAGADSEAAPAAGGIPRGRDRNAKHTGQYAIATRILAPNLNNTEFGIYHANYHSRTPLISGTLSTAGPGAGGANAATYFNKYPENIALYGLSFNTLGPMGVALQGEYSYRPNQPLQLVANNLLTELLSFGAAPLNTGIDPGFGPGAEVDGFRRVKTHQLQMTATQTFGRYLGASQIIGVAEAGYTYLDLPNNIDFNGPGVDFTTPSASSTKGIMTKNSYGYRALVRATYTNAIGAINLTPRVAFQHDVRGTSPTFVEGTKAASIGLTADYQNRISADVSYTNFFGGRTIGENNPTPGIRSTNQQLDDRDFIAATISYAF
jgi:hypothetical protein